MHVLFDSCNNASYIPDKSHALGSLVSAACRMPTTVSVSLQKCRATSISYYGTVSKCNPRPCFFPHFGRDSELRKAGCTPARPPALDGLPQDETAASCTEASITSSTYNGTRQLLQPILPKQKSWYGMEGWLGGERLSLNGLTIIIFAKNVMNY